METLKFLVWRRARAHTGRKPHRSNPLGRPAFPRSKEGPLSASGFVESRKYKGMILPTGNANPFLEHVLVLLRPFGITRFPETV